jgi:glycosyltransferase involved in cell wall biosynthesis
MPELILGHTGWGEMLFLRAVVPSARFMGFNELYYQSSGGDLGFDPEFLAEPEAAKRLLVRNLHLTSSLMACDLGITPTQWQADCFPPLLRERIQVIHDGIETDKLTPDPKAWIRLEKAGIKLKYGDEVITFVNRNLEPMRGYHQFMRALPEILSQRERAQVVIVGGDGVSYGKAPIGQKGFKEIYFNEVKDRIDLSRVHFVNRVPYESLVTLLRISAAHVYLTVPFVLSWSMLEAMSLGALVIGSSTPPVQEVIEHERNGLLVDFFSPEDIAGTVCKVLAQPVAYKAMRAQARQDIVERYDFRQVSLPRYMRLIQGH